MLVPLLASAVLAASPIAKPLAIGAATWGMSTAQIEQAYPGGRLDVRANGKAVYQAASSNPLGVQANALASFGFSRDRLGLVVLEFPAGVKGLVKWDYLRPSMTDAEALRVKLVASLSSRFGPPSYDKSGPGGQSMGWSKGVTYAGLHARRIGDDRQDLRVVLTVDAEVVPDTGLQSELLDGAFFRTSPDQWSQGGAMGLRWGMGPGDAKDVYPDLEASKISYAYAPTYKYSVKTFAEDEVVLTLEFFRGQLVEIWADRLDLYSNLGDGDLRMAWAATEYWRKKVLAILVEKYGAPLQQPSDEDLEKALATGRPRDSLFWRWRTDDTGIEFRRDNQAAQFLRYLALGDLGRRAWDSKIQYDKAQEAARKAKF